MYKFHNEYGFTLTEVLIAMVVLAIGLLGLARLNIAVIRGNVSGKQLTVATTLAQDRIEEIQRRGYTNANTAAGTQAYGTIADYPAYKRVTTINANTPATNMITATVTVFWNADAHSVTLNTILGQ
jgi:type IV pilus modification protein PilV